MHLFYSPKFSITIVLDFSWDDRNIQTGNNGYVKFWGLNKVHYGLCESSELANFLLKNGPNGKQATTNKRILFSLQSSMLAVSETPVVEQFHKWMAVTSWFETSIEGELTQLKSVLQQPCGEATKPLLYSIRVGVLLVPEHT